MKITNETGEASNFDPGGVYAPRLFYGPGAPSTEVFFSSAPKMSLYWDVTNAIIYVKTASTNAAADWKPLVAAGVTTTGNVTVTGDMTVTGTLLAGDILASAGS